MESLEEILNKEEEDEEEDEESPVCPPANLPEVPVNPPASSAGEDSSAEALFSCPVDNCGYCVRRQVDTLKLTLNYCSYNCQYLKHFLAAAIYFNLNGLFLPVTNGLEQMVLLDY